MADPIDKGRFGAARIPLAVWAPLAAGGLMLLAGGLGLAFHQLWLFPSLGPTAILQVETPESPGARFYHTVVGHLVGMLAGVVAVLVLAAGDPPVFLAHALTPGRVLAAVLAIALSSLGGVWLKANHPPAAATTLLIALGAFRPIPHDLLAIAAGVLVVATAGEGLRRWRTGEPLSPRRIR